MTRSIAILILIILAVVLAVIISTEHRINGLAMPMLVAAVPANAVPWTLNTRCAVNSRNLVTRDPERNA